MPIAFLSTSHLLSKDRKVWQPLSTVANAVAIVGLADVSFRAVKELYVFFSAVKGASKEVKSLWNERQDINIILWLFSDSGGSPHSF